MNKIFKIIWSVAHGDWVVTSEQASAVQGGTRRTVNRMGLKLSGVALALMMVLGVSGKAEAYCDFGSSGGGTTHATGGGSYVPPYLDPAIVSSGQLSIAAYTRSLEITNCQFSDNPASTLYDITTNSGTDVFNLTINNQPAGNTFDGTARGYALIGDIDLSGRTITNGGVSSITVNGGGIGVIRGLSGNGTVQYALNGGNIEQINSIDNSSGVNQIVVNGANLGFRKDDPSFLAPYSTGGEWGIDNGGGTGTDIIELISGNVTGIKTGDGNNTLTLTGGSVYKVQTGAGNDTIYLKGTQFVSAGMRTVMTGAGDDQVIIDGGANSNPMNLLATLDGEAGNNTLSVENFVLNKTTGDAFAHVGGSTNILNFGTVNLNGGGVLNLDENSDPYTLTQLNITAGGQLNATGTTAIIDGAVTNNGTIDLARDALGNRLVIDGNYSGAGLLRVRAELGTDDSTADALTIRGAIAADTRTVVDLAPLKATHPGKTVEGIVIVEVERPEANAAGENAFTLARDFSAGLYDYNLALAAVGTSKAGSFVLQNQGVSPRVSVYSLNVLAAETLVLGHVGSFRDRGNTQGAGVQASTDDAGGITQGRSWLRAHYDRIDQQRGASGLDQKAFRFQAGYNLVENGRLENGGGLIRRGLWVGYGDASGDVEGRDRRYFNGANGVHYSGAGKIDTRSYSLGAYQTHFWGNGVYLDGVGQISLMDNTLKDIDNHRAKTQGWNGYLSAELGRTIPIGSRRWRIEPQVQAIVSRTEMDGFNDGEIFVDEVSQNLVRARAGAWLFNDLQTSTSNTALFYTLANVWHDITPPDRIKLNDAVDTLRIRPETVRTWVEAGFGLQYTLSDNRVTVFGDIRGQHAIGSGERDGLGGQIGLKAHW